MAEDSSGHYPGMILAMKVVSVVGARPQFVKLAPVAAAFAETEHEHRIVHTGQHYDVRLSDVFFDELAMPDPDHHLDVGSASHAIQTGAMLTALEPVLDEEAPDWVLVYGDTNSTLAAALTAVKLHLPVAHLEAGLRSFNRRMPEEHNRVLADHAADLLLAPTAVAMQQLNREGLAQRSVQVGDVMADVLLAVRDGLEDRLPQLPATIAEAGDYLVATIHRADNTGDAIRLRTIIDALAGLPLPVMLLAHPRLVASASRYGVDLDTGAIHPLPPLPYRAMVAAVLASRGVVTDSGGLQKEAFLLRVPCTTIRSETEWPETLDGSWNALCGDLRELADTVMRPIPLAPTIAHFGQGSAAQEVVRSLAQWTFS